MPENSWTDEEDLELINAFEKVTVGGQEVNWKHVSDMLGGRRSKQACKARYRKKFEANSTPTGGPSTTTETPQDLISRRMELRRKEELRRPRGTRNVGWGTMPQYRGNASTSGPTSGGRGTPEMILHSIESSMWAADETESNPRTAGMWAGHASGLPIDWTEEMVEQRYQSLDAAINEAMKTGEGALLMYKGLKRGEDFMTINGNGDVSKRGEGRISHDTAPYHMIQGHIRSCRQFWCILRVFPWTLSSQRNQKRKRVYLFAYDFNASEWLKMTPEVCEDECEHNPQMFCYGANCLYDPRGTKIWLQCDYY